MEKLGRVANRVRRFWTRDIWEMDAGGDRKVPALKLLRILAVAVRDFIGDKIPTRASALTFYTLLSVVPVLAMAFGISKGFGFEKVLERLILENVPGQEMVLHKLIGFARSLLEETKGGMVAGIGLVVLFYTVLSILHHIETAFNHIWKVENARPWRRKFSGYFSVMILSPLLFVLYSSITVFVTVRVTAFTEEVKMMQLVSPIIFLAFKFLPFGLIWGALTLMYLLMPNTRVRFLPALVAGLVAGTLYLIIQWGYIHFQVGIARNNAIYGSFAALPLFLIWLQVSWLVVLFGGELAHAAQNHGADKTGGNRSPSARFRRLAGLAAVHFLVKRFQAAKPPATTEEMARILHISPLLVSGLMKDFEKAGLVSRVTPFGADRAGYQPGRDIRDIRVVSVIEALEDGEEDPQNIDKEMEPIRETLEQLHRALGEHPANKPLVDL